MGEAAVRASRAPVQVSPLLTHRPSILPPLHDHSREPAASWMCFKALEDAQHFLSHIYLIHCTGGSCGATALPLHTPLAALLRFLLSRPSPSAPRWSARGTARVRHEINRAASLVFW